VDELGGGRWVLRDEHFVLRALQVSKVGLDDVPCCELTN